MKDLYKRQVKPQEIPKMQCLRLKTKMLHEVNGILNNAEEKISDFKI